MRSASGTAPPAPKRSHTVRGRRKTARAASSAAIGAVVYSEMAAHPASRPAPKRKAPVFHDGARSSERRKRSQARKRSAAVQACPKKERP